MVDVVAHVKKESTINQFTNYEFTMKRMNLEAT
jgi:hypothetical protein